MKRSLILLTTAVLLLALVGLAEAATYHVGSGQTYSTMPALLSAVTLGDNDVVLVHAGTYGPFSVFSGGGSSEATATVIRAYDMNNKPVFDGSGVSNCVHIEAGSDKWFVLEGLEVENADFRGIYHVGGGLIIRSCYIHHCQNGIMSGMYNTREDSPGYLIAEYNELAYNGEGNFRHSCYIQEYWTEFRYNWIHDPASGLCYKDRSRDTIFEYNLVEQGPNAGYTVEFCGYDDDGMPDIGQTATMVGNVVTKYAGGNSWLFIGNERGEGGVTGGQNLGWLYLINNTFYTESHTGPMLGTDDGSIITAHNNIFHTTTCDTMIEQVDYASSPGTVETSYNNWVNSSISVPSAFTDTVFGTNPGVVSAAWSGGDWHLTSGSPCVNAGYNGVSPAPVYEYVHPYDYTPRYDDTSLDIGAYEYVGGPVPLSANFSGAPTSGGPPPLTVNFTDLSTGSPTSWSWSFGDTGTSTAQDPSHQYTGVGTYTVSLTVNDGSTQDTETKTDYITVSEAAPVVTVYPDTWESYGGDATVTITSGSLADVDAADDVYMVAACDAASQKGSMEFTFLTGYAQAEVDKITVRYQLHGTRSDNPSYLFFMKQGDVNTWTVMRDGTWYTTDEWFTWETTNIALYMGAGGRLTTSICGCPQNTNNYSTYLDLISIELQLAGGGPVVPVANFSGNPTSGTAPLTVSFSDLSTNSPTSWSWNFGDSGTSTAQNPSHQYTSAGDYTVSLTATNAGGSDSETKTNYISVSTAPTPPVADFSGSPTSGNAPLTVSFTDASTNSPTSWSWNFGDSGTSTAQNPSHQYTTEGNYTVSLTATNAGGSDTETKTTYISVSGGGTPVTIYSDGFENGLTGWSTESGARACYCSSQNHYLINIRSGGAMWRTVSTAGYSSITVSCDFQVTSLESGEYFEVLWYDGSTWSVLDTIADGDPDEDGTWRTYTYNIPAGANNNANFAVKLDLYSNLWDNNIYIDNLLVEGVTGGAPSPPVADFSGSPTTGNAPLTVSFTDASTNSPTSWSWSFGDSGTSTAQSPSHQYTSAGNYTVSLTATNAGGSDSETKTNYISVSTPPPPAPVADFSGSPTSGDAPLTVSFTDASTNSPTSWSWSFGDSGTSTAQSPSHQYTSEGNYTVSLTATNAGGSDTETKTNYISVSSGGTPVTIYEDHFVNGLTGWTQISDPNACTCASQGLHLTRMRGGEGFYRTISTAGYSTITVHVQIRMYTTTEPGEYVQALWYDGSNWNVFKQINNGDADCDSQFHTYEITPPAGANNNANFGLRFYMEADNVNWDDDSFVDDLIITGTGS